MLICTYAIPDTLVSEYTYLVYSELVQLYCRRPILIQCGGFGHASLTGANSSIFPLTYGVWCVSKVHCDYNATCIYAMPTDDMICKYANLHAQCIIQQSV